MILWHFFLSLSPFDFCLFSRERFLQLIIKETLQHLINLSILFAFIQVGFFFSKSISRKDFSSPVSNIYFSNLFNSPSLFQESFTSRKACDGTEVSDILIQIFIHIFNQSLWFVAFLRPFWHS